MDAIVYSRISKYQGRDELAPGVEDQTDDGIREAERRGWNVVEVIKDSDESAFEGKFRPGYARLIKLLEDGTAQAVVARGGDRLHRDLAEYLVWEKLVRRKKIATAFYKGTDFDLQTASGRMSSQIVNVIAQAYSETIRENVNRAMERRAIQGLPANTAARPYGYEQDSITIRESEAQLLREGAADLLAGRTSLRALAEKCGLTHRGLKGALLSPRMVAKRAYGGQLFPAVWPPVLDDGTWDSLHVLLGQSNRPKNSGKRAHLLSGLARCGSCEGRLSVDKERSGERTYRCRNTGCTKKVSRQATELEYFVAHVVLEAVSEMGERPASALEEDAAVLAEIRVLDERLAELEQRISGKVPSPMPLEKLESAYATGLARRNELVEQVGKFAPLPDLPDQWPWGERMEEWEDWWHAKDRTLSERQAVIGSQVRAVLIQPTKRGAGLDRGAVQLLPR